MQCNGTLDQCTIFFKREGHNIYLEMIALVGQISVLFAINRGDALRVTVGHMIPIRYAGSTL